MNFTGSLRKRTRTKRDPTTETVQCGILALPEVEISIPSKAPGKVRVHRALKPVSSDLLPQLVDHAM
jgi:hypothetical protein